MFAAADAGRFAVNALTGGTIVSNNKMDKKELAIATIAWARTEQEESALRLSLEQLATLGIPVFITDGGSSSSFLSFLQGLPFFTVLSAKGLWAQARKSIAAASQSGANVILYTEPDKFTFFRDHLPEMIAQSSMTNEDGVILASRSAAGFASFPPFQQVTETTINQCCKDIIGKDIDYCYGPFLFNAVLVPLLDTLPENCGWGWRPFLFATAYRKGLSISAFVADFACPPEQQGEDATERIYRMKQLAQNIDGLVQAATAPL